MKPLTLCAWVLAASSVLQPSVKAGEAMPTNHTPAFDAQMVFSFGRGREGATHTIAVRNVLGATNCCELPGGTLEFFFHFEGQRHGKDIWAVGERFPVGQTNQTFSMKRIAYAGKRASVRLNQDDTVVIEPRQGTK